MLDACRKFAKIDPAEFLPQSLPEPIEYRSHREFFSKVLSQEVDLRARGDNFIHKDEEGPDSPSVRYREQLNRNGSPSEVIAAGYQWKPGTELAEETPDIQQLQETGASLGG